MCGRLVMKGCQGYGCGVILTYKQSASGFATSEVRRKLEPKCIPQFFQGSSLEMRWWAAGQFSSLSAIAVLKVYVKFSQSSFLFFSRVVNDEMSLSQWRPIIYPIGRFHTVIFSRHITVGERVVCHTAVFSVVMQRSSPQTAAENRTTFLSLCVCGLTTKPILYKKIDNTWAAGH